ncbi:hypothetical protein [Paenibacillus eucommiae]|uniref:Uncharacterized protein n=1 Tax=Paenibacillus eucommiae TaxID=1355755 RepID=A0ABS4IRX8_9BACL|nr:hypothetical protein [Paenibacillus eucommiae]MBP1990321.1 hypothetical protein [Paenibacillus eucommiae]
MFSRKLLSAYFTSILFILYFALNAMKTQSADPSSIEHFSGWSVTFAMFIIPIVFVYGIGISYLADLLGQKWEMKPTTSVILSFLIHIAMGALFGMMLGLIGIGIVGGAAAACFFLVDQWIAFLRSRQKKAWIIVTLNLPLLVFCALLVYFYAKG